MATAESGGGPRGIGAHRRIERAGVGTQRPIEAARPIDARTAGAERPAGAERRARRRPFGEVPADARQYAVRMPDGVRLATDVYLPAGGGRWPVLLCRLPYDKCGEECFIPRIARWFVQRGYAVVAQDVRGKVRSGGELDPFTSEAPDGYHTLEWLVDQRWCNGAIGMFGDSYYGFTQWAAASTAHPALRAIAPRVTSADMGDALQLNGVFQLESTACWCLETWVDEALYDYDGELDWRIRPLCEIVPEVLGGARPVGLDDYAAGRIPAAARVPVNGAVPALHLAGAFDFLLSGQLATWRRALAGTSAQRGSVMPGSAARGSAAGGDSSQLLLFDATDHSWTRLRPAGEPWLDPAAAERTMQAFLEDYLGPVAEFFDRFLREDGDRRPLPRVRWRLGHGPDRWLHSPAWPPPESRPIAWTLLPGEPHGDGTLSIRGQRARASARIVHDPGDPVPSQIHPYFPLVDPPDEQDVHRRSDVCSFCTDPASEDLDLVGPIHLRLSLAASGPSAHLIATLCDVRPDGGTQRILDTAVLVRRPWPQTVSLTIGETAYRIRAGHRLRLVLAGSAFPRYVLHPGTDEDPWTAVSTARNELRIALGGCDGAILTAMCLPRRGEARQPRGRRIGGAVHRAAHIDEPAARSAVQIGEPVHGAAQIDGPARGGAPVRARSPSRGPDAPAGDQEPQLPGGGRG